jgi:two-component system sensor histidine kinase KdpD
VSVSDAGPGLPPLATERIFKPFYRPADSRAPGTGLGLAVAKGLVEANGGRIWAENLPGGGARFVFTLPIVDQPAAAA